MTNHRININGTVYAARFSFSTLLALEELYQFNAFDLGKFSPKSAVCMIWGAIHDAAPKLTLQELAGLLDMATLRSQYIVALEAYKDAFPSPADEKAAEAAAQS